ncbi:MAG: hypothetical protein KIS79_16515 [Burkholderiales bacterium]|nr:hypothetical protein [Burkholderiales bacterium]
MAANEITADTQVARIFEWRRGFNTIYLIHLGAQLGLFKAGRNTWCATPRSSRGSACRGAIRGALVHDRLRHGAARR